MVEDASVNTGAVVWPTAEVAADAVRRMQLKLHRWARGDSSRRFGDLLSRGRVQGRCQRPGDPLPLPRSEHRDPVDTETDNRQWLTFRIGTWRAGCGESRTSGSAGGLGKRVGSNPDTAPQADPTGSGRR